MPGTLLLAQERPELLAESPDPFSLNDQLHPLFAIDQVRFYSLLPPRPVPHLTLPPSTSPFPVTFSKDLPSNFPASPDSSITSNHPDSESDQRFRLGPAFRESLLYTGIMHAFDLGTQAGTRDALNGEWFHQYIQSVSELRGWADS